MEVLSSDSQLTTWIQMVVRWGMFARKHTISTSSGGQCLFDNSRATRFIFTRNPKSFAKSSLFVVSGYSRYMGVISNSTRVMLCRSTGDNFLETKIQYWCSTFVPPFRPLPHWQ